MKKIMFSERYGLTQAVLEGKKTMTRRLMTMTLHRYNKYGQMVKVEPNEMFIASDGTAHFKFGDKSYAVPKENQPSYHVGEEVAIAQSYKDLWAEYLDDMDNPIYKELVENFSGNLFSAGHDNKMFVKADLMPHRIRITGIKLERLQDITDEDCLKEGVEKWIDCYIVSGIMENQGKNNVCFDSPREAFAALIDRISGRGTWQRNPWTYAYTFELIK
ncbi:MAG: hypothetical protein SPK72_07705 [Bacteroidales bacterium]|nr:hypothetical protein [Bacteroidales bacterium]